MLSHFRNGVSLTVPLALKELSQKAFVEEKKCHTDEAIQKKFESIHHHHVMTLQQKIDDNPKMMKIGCLFSGGPAPGGHNVLLGIFDAIKEIHHQNELIGYLDGFDGFLSGKKTHLTHKVLLDHKNTGGFYLLGSARKKMETEEDFARAKKQALDEKLDALCVIGGDDSNTNAAILADFFIREKIPCRVIGVPKTIDGDLRHEFLEISFGFDTAARIYAEQIGNILDDARSAKKYYHFIKLMGRSASHLTLESALLAHPNFTFISEEMTHKSLEECIDELCDMIIARQKLGKNYGCVLVPEGLLEFVPEFNTLIKEINDKKVASKQAALTELSKDNLGFFQKLPEIVKEQIFAERDPHGNIPLSLIQTELVVIEWVKKRLSQKEKEGHYQQKFSPVAHFLGYEGRSGFPTAFDSEYTYALGLLTGKMATSHLTAYMAALSNLAKPASLWKPHAIPLSSMMHLKEIKGKVKPVIEKAFVDPESKVYRKFNQIRERLKTEDDYKSIGPIQFFGPHELVDSRPHVLTSS